MEVKIKSIHFEASEKLHEFIDKKLAKLTKSSDQIGTAEVSLKVVKPETANNKQAGILCNRGSYRTAVVGFPFESIVDENERDTLMSQLLQYLDSK